MVAAQIRRGTVATPHGRALSVLEYHLVSYRRTWRASALSTLVLPLLIMLGFGVGVGSFVNGGVAGVRYLDWLVPGLVASTAAQVAIGEATWPVFSCFEWIRVYFAQAAAPLRVADILAGHLGYMLFRILVSATVFLAASVAFSAVHSWWAPLTLVVSLLTGLAVAAPTVAYSARVSSDSYLAILLRLAVLPMSLFSGVFFPVESLPLGWRWVAYALPLWHGVDLSRDAMLGTAPGLLGAWHVGYLSAWCAAGWWLAHRQFRRRLVV